MSIFHREPPKDWAAIDRENDHGMDIYSRAMATTDLEALNDLWKEANRLVGKRAPADRAAFMAYGYCLGKQDGLREAKRA